MAGALLIAGGAGDTNLLWLKQAADRLGIRSEVVLIRSGEPPALVWSLETGVLEIDGRKIECGSTFLRYDVFAGTEPSAETAAQAAAAWFATLAAFSSVSGLFAFNREVHVATSSKPAMLAIAARHGFRVPLTTISNSAGHLAERGPSSSLIVKPVAGGSYVMGLDEALAETAWNGDVSPAPAIVQNRLAYPELRLYRAGDRFFAFDIASKTLDSRLDRGQVIRSLELKDLPAGLVGRVASLTDALRCDFCAIDFKTDPATGELVFLELNNGPMFMGYDRTTGGAMAEAMVRYLVENSRPSG